MVWLILNNKAMQHHVSWIYFFTSLAILLRLGVGIIILQLEAYTTIPPLYLVVFFLIMTVFVRWSGPTYALVHLLEVAPIAIFYMYIVMYILLTNVSSSAVIMVPILSMLYRMGKDFIQAVKEAERGSNHLPN
jgi:hypothetical protein